WPAAALTLAPRRLAVVCAVLVVLGLGSRFVLLAVVTPREVADKAIYSFTFSRWDALAWGALVAIAIRQPQWQPVLRRVAWPFTAGALVALLLLTIPRRSFNQSDLAVETGGPSLVPAAGAGPVALSIAPPAGPRRS